MSALAVLIALSAVVFLPRLANPFAIKQWIALAGALLLTAGFCAFRSTIDRRRLLLLLPGLASLPAVLFASNPRLALLGSLHWIALPLAAGLATDRGFRNAATPALALAGSAVAALAIAQRIVGEPLHFGLQALGKMSAFSSLGNPNLVAFFLLAVAPFALLRLRRPTYAVVCALLLGGLIASGSRSVLISGLLAVGFTLLISDHKRFRVLGAVGFVGAIGAGLAFGLRTHTGRGRWLAWLESFEIIKAAPLHGVGLGNFSIHQRAAQAAVFGNHGYREALGANAGLLLNGHSEVINLWAEAGPIAALGFAALALLPLWFAKARSRRQPTLKIFYAAYVAQLGFLAFNCALFYAPLALMFFATWALLVPEGRGIAISRATRLLVSAAALLVFGVTALWGARAVRAGTLEFQADALLETGPFSEAADLYARVVRMDPSNGYAREKQALAHYFAGDVDEALTALDEAERTFGDVGIPYLRAEILARAGRLSEAAVIYEDIRVAFPGHVTPPFMLGQIYRELDQPEASRQALESVVAMPDATHNLKLDRNKIREQKLIAGEILAELSETSTTVGVGW